MLLRGAERAQHPTGGRFVYAARQRAMIAERLTLLGEGDLEQRANRVGSGLLLTHLHPAPHRAGPAGGIVLQQVDVLQHGVQFRVVHPLDPLDQFVQVLFLLPCEPAGGHACRPGRRHVGRQQVEVDGAQFVL